MRRAWVVLLASCGFTGPIANQPDPDARPDSPPGLTCWTNELFAELSACVATTALPERIEIRSMVSLDTDPDMTGMGTSNDPNVTCLPSENGKLCMLAADSILIVSDATLTVHGARALALLAHSIQIDGVLDVASHVRGSTGPGATSDKCNSGSADAREGGGGAGGTYDGGPGSGVAGNGGEQGGRVGTAGLRGSSTATTVLRAGCYGGRGGNNTPSGDRSRSGGAGGGAVWIAVDDTGSLALGSTAVVNASGAGGLGGPIDFHGGDGGGSGGLIVLQSPTIQITTSTRIYANGGGGGGGAQGDTPGTDGADPTAPGTGGTGGAGGNPAPTHGAASHRARSASNAAIAPGGGGTGFPDLDPDGAPGDSNVGGGGGGGGGGKGVIRVFSTTPIGGANISPQPAS